MHPLNLTRPAPPWITVVERNSSTLQNAVAAAEGAGGRVIRMDGRQLTSAESIFDECARNFKFPPYFGRNWDALQECLEDSYRWLRSELVVVVFDDPESILSGYPEQLLTFLEVLHAVSEFIAEPVDDEGVLNRPGVAMHFLLTPQAQSMEPFVERLKACSSPDSEFAVAGKGFGMPVS